jgi:DNA (cytosine-5)-methyltransferase 1
LWPTWFRLIESVRPDYVIGEQVPGAIEKGWLDRTWRDMESAGYIGGATILGADALDAPHERRRLYFAFTNTAKHGRQGIQRGIETQVSEDWSPQALAAWNATSGAFGNWKKLLAEPNVCRVADGVSSTVDIRPRLRAYGNAIVPQVAALFIRAFMESVGEVNHG